MRRMEHLTDCVNDTIGKPWVFAAGVIAILIWGMSGPVFRYSDTWQLVINTSTTIVTFLLGLLIQGAQNRADRQMDAVLKDIRHMMKEQDQILAYIAKQQRDELEEDVEILEILKRMEEKSNIPPGR